MVERGSRPRNRRALIVTAATERFYRDGYDHLRMSDLAEAVGIGPSALYRHFTGKQDLLREVIDCGLRSAAELFRTLDLSDRETALQRLGAHALDERHLGILWQREARHLPHEDYVRARREVRTIGDGLADQVFAARQATTASGADLLACSVTAVLTSPSFHRVEMPRPQYDALLGDLVAAVLDTPIASDFPAPGPAEPAPTLTPYLRREALLSAAIRLFARSGYTEVGIEDIAAAAGITGASVYNYFSSKYDLLFTALQRAAGAMQTDLAGVYSTAPTASSALRELVRSYVAFSQRHHDLVDLLITETGQLSDEQREYGLQAQHDYVSEWAHLLRLVHPDMAESAARIRVHAALGVANDMARTPHLRTNPSISTTTRAVCARLLLLPAE